MSLKIHSQKENSNISVEWIYKRYKDTLYQCAYKILKNEQDALDSVQITFIKIFKILDKLNHMHDEQIRLYMQTVVKNTSLDMIRKNNKMHYQPIEDYVDVCIDECNLEEQYLSNEKHTELIHIIKRGLKKEYAELIMLKYHLDLDDILIMNALNLNSINFRVKLSRAKKAARSLLEKKNTFKNKNVGAYE